MRPSVDYLVRQANSFAELRGAAYSRIAALRPPVSGNELQADKVGDGGEWKLTYCGLS